MSLISKKYPTYLGSDAIIPFTIVNNSTSKKTNITLVFDPLPAGISLTDVYYDLGDYDSMSKTWSISHLDPGQDETIWLVFETFDLSEERVITGTITNAENADYPGEGETTVSATIILHTAGDSFEGFATKELLSIVSTNGSYPIELNSGVGYIITATGNTTIELPSIGTLDDGFYINIKIVDDNSHTITVDPGDITIEGLPSETLTTGDFRKYVLLKTNTPVWLKFNN